MEYTISTQKLCIIPCSTVIISTPLKPNNKPYLNRECRLSAQAHQISIIILFLPKPHITISAQATYFIICTHLVIGHIIQRKYIIQR